jgi:hypothetical protein
MEIGSIFVLLVIVAATVYYVAKPIMEKKKYSSGVSNGRLSSLQAEREQVLLALEELEMDFSIGKIAAANYEEQRAEMVGSGAAILKELDALSEKTTDASVKPSLENADEVDDLDAEIERVIAQRRQQPTQQTNGFCSQCGTALKSDDRFCVRCGTPVLDGEAEA